MGSTITCFDGIAVNNRQLLHLTSNLMRLYGGNTPISYPKSSPFSNMLSICNIRGSFASLNENQTLKIYGTVINNPTIGLTVGALYNTKTAGLLFGSISKLILYNRALSWEEEYNTAMNIKQKYPSLWT